MLPEIEAALDRDYDVCRMTQEEGRARADAQPEAIRAVVTGGGTGLDPAWFDRLDNLGIIAVNGVGTDKVDLERARRRGVHVTTTPGVLTDDVADIGMALVLASLRRLGEGERMVRAGDWARGGKLPLATSLKGKTIGILGLGQIGKALARRAEAFGMRVAYWNRSDVADAGGWQRSDTPRDLAEAADILAVCVAANPQTEGMVDAAVIDALGPNGTLVNVARGSVVDEAALIEALKDRRIAGAGLDVFLNEPQINPAIVELDNVVLMPHQGSATLETRQAMGAIVLDNLHAYFAGRTPPHCVVHPVREAAQ
nr:2-hydroxyacid dehydrogenase [Pararhizobium haloflavum]